MCSEIEMQQLHTWWLVRPCCASAVKTEFDSPASSSGTMLFSCDIQGSRLTLLKGDVFFDGLCAGLD